MRCHKCRTYKPKAPEYNYPLHVAIRAQKNGWEDTHVDILYRGSDDMAAKYEKDAILSYKTYLPDFGFNQKIGMELTKEAGEAQSIRQKAYYKIHPISDEIKLRLRNNCPLNEAVICYKYETGELVGNFISHREAQDALGLNPTSINKVLSGKHLKTHGYYFILDKGQEIKENIKIPPFILVHDFKTGEFVADYLSVQHACKDLNISWSSIYDNLSGFTKNTKGLTFKYASESTALILYKETI